MEIRFQYAEGVIPDFEREMFIKNQVRKFLNCYLLEMEVFDAFVYICMKENEEIQIVINSECRSLNEKIVKAFESCRLVF